MGSEAVPAGLVNTWTVSVGEANAKKAGFAAMAEVPGQGRDRGQELTPIFQPPVLKASPVPEVSDRTYMLTPRLPELLENGPD